MTTLEDSELLRRYASDRSEAAFAELVRRHLPPVYAFAVRQVGGDAHLAEDVAQMVFTALARKAHSLIGRQALGGWLYRTTHFAARDVVRVERRRRTREQEALTMQESTTNPEASIDWEKMQPVLDETLHELSEDDRDAVWLRFFEGRTFAEVGARLRLTENAARMRVERALDKLHGLLAQRGMSSTTAALAVALTGHTIAAPASLAVSVTASALAATGAGTGATATMIFMGMNKLQMGLGGALVALTATGIAFQQDDGPKLREIAALNAQNQELASTVENNRGLAGAAATIAGLRADAAALPALQQEAERLKAELLAAERVSTPRGARPSEMKMLTPVVAEEIPISQLDSVPQVMFRNTVQYPFEMRRLGVEGEVVVEFVVDSEGNVSDAFAVRSSQSEFEANALASVNKWKFKPGVKAAQNVNTRMQVPIVFALEERSVRSKNIDWF